jgi:surface antigen|tara:strand:+ start:214 stop:684 length:471 start_codon:yes stop_codon:yes gene_type:complete
MRTILIIVLGILLTNCASNRSQVGAVLGSTTTTGACVEMGVNDPYAIAGCAVVGAFAGAEIMYNSDYDVHNAVFVDHLNTSPNGASYTNWYNQETGNSGIIKITKSYLVEDIKCKDYDATVDITNRWPLIGVGGVNRNTIFGTACQMPDGRWIEKP